MKVYRKAIALLSDHERRRLYLLFGAVVVMAILEVVGIASVAPFLALVVNPDVVHTNPLLRQVYEGLGFTDHTQFLIFAGTVLLVLVAISNGFTMLVTWALVRYSWMRGYAVSRRLLEHYLAMPYVFFLNRNSAVLGKNVLAEVKEVVTGIYKPGLQMLSKGVVCLAIIALLVVADPLLALVMMVVLGGSYGAIYYVVRRKLTSIGRLRVETNALRYKATGEAFGGVKDVKLLGREQEFLRRYAEAAKVNASVTATADVIGKLPKYMVTTAAFGGIVFIVIFMLLTRGDIANSIPILGLYAFASQRLMPAFQEIFQSLSRIRSRVPALDNIYRDLQHERTLALADRHQRPGMNLKRALELHNVSYTYPETDGPSLSKLNLRIEANTTVAFVGSTGAGKTTAVDLILGLLEPSEGEIHIDGVRLSRENMPEWQNSLGYVPQHIYLSDDTIAANIAFGIPRRKINAEAVRQAAKIANINEFIETELEKGYDTRVGDRGIRLSGGQRQRIGIARALYHDPTMIVLDEATSALDAITEESVFQALENVKGQKTLIMIAHRITTIRTCDEIFVLERGRLLASGSFDHLRETCEPFRRLAAGVVSPQGADAVAAGSRSGQ